MAEPSSASVMHAINALRDIVLQGNEMIRDLGTQVKDLAKQDNMQASDIRMLTRDLETIKTDRAALLVKYENRIVVVDKRLDTMDQQITLWKGMSMALTGLVVSAGAIGAIIKMFANH